MAREPGRFLRIGGVQAERGVEEAATPGQRATWEGLVYTH
jgi:hypothetical protein